jgi:hypothetical protein
MSTQHFQGLLLSLEHRIRDLKDWIDRHDLPYRTQISALLHEESSPHNLLEVLCHFDSYKEANRWAWLHCKCTDSQHGVDAKRVSGLKDGAPKSYIWIQMPDFRITLIFPSSTHPECNLMPV